jgi:hypothetical protein
LVLFTNEVKKWGKYLYMATKGEYKSYNIIIPVWVLNLIENERDFNSSITYPTQKNGLFNVGVYCGLTCYCDPGMPLDKVFLSLNKESKRNSTIDFILDSKKQLDDLLILDVSV